MSGTWVRMVVLLVGGFSLPACRPESAEGPTEEDLLVGEQAYASLCAACHGDRGAGDGPLNFALVQNGFEAAPPHDDPDRVRMLGRDGIIRAMQRGHSHEGPPSLMPEWERDLGHEIDGLIADFVLSFSRPPVVTVHRGGERADFSADSMESGARLFHLYCASCHGPTGRGRTMDRGLGGAVASRDLTQSQTLAKRTDQQLYNAIALGGRHAGPEAIMPGWVYELEPAQIRALVAHVRTLSNTTPH